MCLLFIYYKLMISSNDVTLIARQSHEQRGPGVSPRGCRASQTRYGVFPPGSCCHRSWDWRLPRLRAETTHWNSHWDFLNDSSERPRAKCWWEIFSNFDWKFGRATGQTFCINKRHGGTESSLALTRFILWSLWGWHLSSHNSGATTATWPALI